MKNLVSFPLLQHEAGKLPPIPPHAYVGFFDALARRLVFVFDHETGQACLYVSTEGWDGAFVMQPGRLPGGIILDSPEAAWAVACWKIVRSRFVLGTGL
jgi:hypothetical protein